MVEAIIYFAEILRGAAVHELYYWVSLRMCLKLSYHGSQDIPLAVTAAYDMSAQ